MIELPEHMPDMVTRDSMIQAFDELGKRHENERAALMREIATHKACAENWRLQVSDLEGRIEELETALNKAGRLVINLLTQNDRQE